MSGNAISTVFIDNDRVRVTEWRFPPGTATGWHRHELDYVVVPLTTGQLTMADREGKETKAELQVGVPYFRPAGVEHNVINRSDFEIAFVETEVK